MTTRIALLTLRRVAVVLYGIAFFAGGVCATVLVNLLRNVTGKLIEYSVYTLLEDVLCYVLIPGIPTAISVFIVGSAFRRKKGLTFRILYWVLYATLGLVSVFCLLLCDNESLLFGVPTAIFLLAWFPFRNDRCSSNHSARTDTETM